MRIVAKAMKAVVRNGRIVLDEPTTLPDGSVLELQVVDPGDDMSDHERERLHNALDESLEQADRGETIPADGVFAELRSRS